MTAIPRPLREKRLFENRHLRRMVVLFFAFYGFYLLSMMLFTPPPLFAAPIILVPLVLVAISWAVWRDQIESLCKIVSGVIAFLIFGALMTLPTSSGIDRSIKTAIEQNLLLTFSYLGLRLILPILVARSAYHYLNRLFLRPFQSKSSIDAKTVSAN